MPQTENVFEVAYRASRDYMDNLNSRPIIPSSETLQALKTFKEPMPKFGQNASAVIQQLHEAGSPNTVATTGGRFYGFVVGGALPVAVAANWLATTWDQNAGTWVLSPIAGDLEDIAGRWMLELLDLPRDAVFGFVTGATMATFSSIASARSALLRRRGYDVKRSGLGGAPRMRIIMSEEIHPTNKAALGYAGFGLDQIEYVAVDKEGRIKPDELPELDDLSIVLVQAGNINSGSFDNFQAVTKKAKQAGAWVHVDGAFGLWARASKNKRHLTQGMELADSWSVDGHKWLNLPHESAIYFCRDAQAVDDVFGISATYLVRDENRQGNNFTPELSRRARGVEFWAALKFLGKEGIAEIVDQSCTHAEHFAEGLKNIGLSVLNDVVLNQIVFSAGSEDMTRLVLKEIQNTGTLWLGPTTWQGQFAMRISVSSVATTEADVEASLVAIKTAFLAAREAV
ncbi:MAG: aspartate aminotransferase family protein [Kordiimonadaceae bacterium]|jgi:glutamate/tyrosine decarboxylase-like PLP-dependent enzyme|nr:aspartate aminotransferase family protein [Kordiimonadaceae bacterium]